MVKLDAASLKFPAISNFDVVVMLGTTTKLFHLVLFAACTR
jgi:hypothetical protein